MFNLKSTLHLRILLLTTLLVVQVQHVHAALATGSIAGAADPGAQVVVTSVDDSKVIGVVAKCDGTYRVDGLKAGNYEIVEGGLHHAVRKLSVAEGKTSQVDLAPTHHSKANCPN